MSDNRPTPRSRPRPAGDSGADPADFGPAPEPVRRDAPSAQSQLSGEDAVAWNELLHRSSDRTRQLSNRVSEDTAQLLDDVHKTTGVSIRKLLEFCIHRTFGTEEGRQLWHKK